MHTHNICWKLHEMMKYARIHKKAILFEECLILRFFDILFRIVGADSSIRINLLQCCLLLL